MDLGILLIFQNYQGRGSDDESLMLDKFTSVTRAMIKGTFLIGILQGSLAGIAFAVAGFNKTVPVTCIGHCAIRGTNQVGDSLDALHIAAIDHCSTPQFGKDSTRSRHGGLMAGCQ